MLDLEPDDLPDSLLDRWMSEGFQRIMRRAQRWPHLEVSETITTTAGTQTAALGEVARIRAIHGPRGELLWMDEADARQKFWNVTTPVPAGWPRAWSEWGDGIMVWPEPDSAYLLTVLGYRSPSVAWVGVAGAEPDMPERYHEVLLSWVMYRTYQQQDDLDNAQIEKGAFEEGLSEMTGDDLSTPSASAGMVLGGNKSSGRATLNSRLPYDDGWE